MDTEESRKAMRQVSAYDKKKDDSESEKYYIVELLIFAAGRWGIPSTCAAVPYLMHRLLVPYLWRRIRKGSADSCLENKQSGLRFLH